MFSAIDHEFSTRTVKRAGGTSDILSSRRAGVPRSLSRMAGKMFCAELKSNLR
jgi:hypothetical protein